MSVSTTLSVASAASSSPPYIMLLLHRVDIE